MNDKIKNGAYRKSEEDDPVQEPAKGDILKNGIGRKHIIAL